MNHLRRKTNCPVPGHGTRCELARERSGDYYARSTEERDAIRYELMAEGDVNGDGV